MKLVKRIVDGIEKEFFELTEEEIAEMKAEAEKHEVEMEARKESK